MYSMPSGPSTSAIRPPRPPTAPVSLAAVTERAALSLPRKIGVNGSRRPLGSYAIAGSAALPASGSFGRATGVIGGAGVTAAGGGGGGGAPPQPARGGGPPP